MSRKRNLFTRWSLKQRLAQTGRFYGDGGTIHSTGHLDVETNDAGEVVSVWFRCQMLPFKQVQVGPMRADQMGSIENLPAITGVELRDIP